MGHPVVNMPRGLSCSAPPQLKRKPPTTLDPLSSPSRGANLSIAICHGYASAGLCSCSPRPPCFTFGHVPLFCNYFPDPSIQLRCQSFNFSPVISLLILGEAYYLSEDLHSLSFLYAALYFEITTDLSALSIWNIMFFWMGRIYSGHAVKWQLFRWWKHLLL